MSKIDLKAILAKRIVQFPSDENMSDKDIKRNVIKVMEEVWNTAVDECKKAAHLSDFACEFLQEGADGAIVMEDIEQVKQMIL